jgi:hypothetical protein
MRARVNTTRLVLLQRESAPEIADGRLPDGLLPLAVLVAVALIRLAAFAWNPVSWGMEESIALAFVLGAGFLLIQYLPENERDSER